MSFSMFILLSFSLLSSLIFLVFFSSVHFTHLNFYLKRIPFRLFFFVSLFVLKITKSEKKDWMCIYVGWCIWVSLCVCLVCAEDLFYLKIINAELFAAGAVAVAVAAGASNTVGKWLKFNWNRCGVSLMTAFRCDEITWNTMHVLSIRFKYWIKSDSDKMYNKIDRLMLLLAQPLCIAAGCSPKKHVAHTRA